MRICAVQIKPIKGCIEENIEKHRRLIEAAARDGAQIIFFPELSVTSYESNLAAELAINERDARFDVFQNLSDRHQMTICIGAPVRSEAGVLIGMLFFQPAKERQSYFKQRLHADELLYFAQGNREVFLDAKDRRIAPAICYESLLAEHAEKACTNGANVYLASVAKSASGVEKGYRLYPAIAKKYRMTVLMANCLGPCDDFESVGQSAIWNDAGELVARLDDENEGLLLYDTEIGRATSLRTSHF